MKTSIDSKIIQRFFTRVQKTGICWLWIGKKNSSGYGTFLINKKTIRAHRFSYEYHKTNIPDGLLVCHACDVRNCVNPEHLFVGTHFDNTKDMVEKKRCYYPGYKTHCKRGHELNETNTYVHHAKRKRSIHIERSCKICKIERQRISRLRTQNNS